MTSSPPPAVGQTVHYVPRESISIARDAPCHAAVITQVAQQPDENMTAGLAELAPAYLAFRREVPYDAGSVYAPIPMSAFDTAPEPACDGRWHVSGSWHWPARIGGPL